MKIQTPIKALIVLFLFPIFVSRAELTIEPDSSKVFCEGANVTLSYTVENPTPPTEPCCKNGGAAGTWTKDTEEPTWSGDADENGKLDTGSSGSKSVSLEVKINWKCDDGSTAETFENKDISYSLEAQGTFAGQTATVAGGATASIALGAGDWGLTYPEYIEATISACTDTSNWHVIVSTITGHYSLQARLLPGEVEVTGPSGNTTSANYCAQVTGLKALGNGTWYMLQAVKDHEAVHEAHFLPALKNVAGQIAQDLEQVTVADSGQSQQAAITAIEASAAYTTALQSAQQTWLQEILQLAANDHNGPAAAAEHAVVDPMVNTICTHASTHSWPACSACP